jgi:hypothetical protein
MKPAIRHYPPSLFWDADECAYHVGRSVSHWRQLVAQGKAPAPVPHHGKVLWLRWAVEGWVQSLAGDATVPPVAVPPRATQPVAADDEWDAE